MLDHPRGPALLDAVARLLRETLIPQLPPGAVFQARVAANAVDLAAREMRQVADAESQARDRLTALLGHDGDLPTLEAELAARLRRGDINTDHPGLQQHLWATTLAKLAIDQPSYAPYRRTLEQLEQRAGTATDQPQHHPKE
ncbi:MAG: hypothetical protein A3E25_13840 [Burkholderiales bacterium RIFCSPHIGHO2_12_FULL_69_20]|nr:MAG: hypothetical protein A3E25_13840 [Burkholderiales bacterium RIFCSPHIGHO2_12_FULL_69_20]